MCLGILPARVPMHHMRAWSLQEEVIMSFAIGVTEGCEPLCGSWE